MVLEALHSHSEVMGQGAHVAAVGGDAGDWAEELWDVIWTEVGDIILKLEQVSVEFYPAFLTSRIQSE